MSESDPTTERLGKRAIRGSAWTMAAFGINQALRLTSALLLSRLLGKETLGLMALVNSIVTGVHLFTDFGIYFTVANSKRQDEPFLNTLWTVQIVRSTTMWLVLVALAWPMSRIYERNPELLYLLPVIGLGPFLSGFQSMAIFTLNRQLNLGRLTIVEIGIQLATIGTMMVCSWLWPTIWVLIGTAILGDLLKSLLSHLCLPRRPHRLAWERETLRELTGFGRWVFLSTIFTFCSTQADRMILAKLLSTGFLAVYNYAMMFAVAVVELGRTMSQRVVLPAVAELVRRSDPGLRSKYARLRARLIGLVAMVLVPLTWGGDILFRWLFPATFHEGGWMLRMLAGGFLAAIVNASAECVFPAVGDSFRMMLFTGVRVVSGIAGMLIGFDLAGERGFVAAIACNELVVYPVLAFFLARKQLWQPGVDLPFLGFMAGSFIASCIVRPLW